MTRLATKIDPTKGDKALRFMVRNKCKHNHKHVG